MTEKPIGKTIGTNFGFNMLSMLVVRLFNLIILPIQTRYLGPGGYGLLNYSLSYASLWTFLGDFGLSKSLVRDIAQDRKNAGRLLGSALVVSAFFSVIGMVAASIVLWAIKPDNLTAWVGFLILSVSFLSIFNGLIAATFSGLEKMHCNTILSVVSKILALVAVVVVFVILSRGVLVYSAALLVIGVIQFFISYKYIQRHVGEISLKPDRSCLKTTLISGTPFLFIMLLGRSSSQIDSVMLMHMLDRDAVGLYQVSYKIVMLLFLLPASLMDAAYPSIARIYPESPRKALEVSNHLSRLMGILSIPIILSVYVFADDLVVLICGDGFGSSASLLKIQIWVCLLAFFAYPMGTLLTCAGFQNDNIIISFLGAAVNIIGNGVLISIYGLEGGVFATLLMGITILSVSFYFIWLRIKSLSFVAPFIYGCFITAISLLPVIALRDSGKVFQLGAGMIIWLFLTVSLGQIRAKDCRMVYNFIRRR